MTIYQDGPIICRLSQSSAGRGGLLLPN